MGYGCTNEIGFLGKIGIIIVYATIWENPFPVIVFSKSFGVSKKKKKNKKKKKRRRNLLAYVNSHIRASPATYSNFCLFGEWTIHFIFYLLTFSNTLSNRLFIFFSISFKYYLFVHFLFFFLSSFILPIFIPNNYIFQWKMLYSQHFLQYFHKNHIKTLCRKLLLVLIWTHRWNYIFTHQY